ncbi:MAG TPA: cyclic nucleotide-binding domain-containing protein [Gallionellaceae bacterium]|nr:cyclic nucleotide-binding domain-containing protein [Gallionellaceae bacterium]
MTIDSLILNALNNSTLTEELRDAEIEALASIITVREYKAGDSIVKEGDNNYDSELGDTLFILGSGEIEVTFTTKGERATLNLIQPGDLAGIIGFVGGNIAQISATMTAKTNCKVLLLNRGHFEGLLNTNGAIVYFVMRGIARYVHGVMRRMNMRTLELHDYLSGTSDNLAM